MDNKLSSIRYFFDETLKSMWRNGIMTIASVTTVMVSVFILGIFMVLYVNSNRVAHHLENSVQVTVYMQDDATDEQINIIGSEIAALQGVIKVNPVTKEEALERFKNRLGENANILNALNDNPLPYSFDVHVDLPNRIDEIVPKIQGMSHVETVRYGKDVVERLFQFTKLLRYGGMVIVALMVIGTMFIIVNTIRLTVYARRKEITIMKYVGATDIFIRWPFLLEGILIGVVGACFSSFILTFMYDAMIYKVQSSLVFATIYDTWPLMFWIWLMLILVGGIVGAAGAYISLRRFLRV